MNIIVFGGSGFLGSHVCDKLSDYGHKVTLFDLCESSWLQKKQEMIIGNILDESTVEKSIKGMDAVYNFAGHADLDTASTDPRETTRQNLIGNLNIIEACIKHKVKQYIYASSIYVYSESGGFYRCSKQASEIYLEEYHRKYALNYTILRYGSLYGTRADERNSIYKYLQKAMSSNTMDVDATGDEMREYIHVNDAAKLSIKVLDSIFYNKRFIITGHQAIPLKQLFQMIEEILKKRLNINFKIQKQNDHYNLTPYSFVPKIGEKMAPDIFIDMGQGLIECMAEIDASNTGGN